MQTGPGPGRRQRTDRFRAACPRRRRASGGPGGRRRGALWPADFRGQEPSPPALPKGEGRRSDRPGRQRGRRRHRAGRSARDSAAKAELFRVLRPGGKALVGDETSGKNRSRKAWTTGATITTAPTTIRSRGTKLARAPLLTQFVAEPRFAPGPQSVVAAAGRVFMALGHVAWHQREEPVVNTLIAVNGFNGTLLWKCPLTPGIMVDRSTMIATPDDALPGRRQLVQVAGCGQRKAARRDRRPGEPGGRHLLEMDGPGPRRALRPGRPRRTAPTPRPHWKRTEHGWPWQGISQGYNNDKEYPWGFARTLLAIDPKTKKVLWRHEEDPADRQPLAVHEQRADVLRPFGRYLACLDAAGGTVALAADRRKSPGPLQGHRALSAGPGLRSRAGGARSI